jgi:D-cysteine desulfhydrase family pyridoxal phosphate-dependent enzyme
MMSSSSSPSLQQPDTVYPYKPPSWAVSKLTNVPKNGRLHLANLPTPLQLIGTDRIQKQTGSSSNNNNNNIGNRSSILSRLKELNINLYIKRDDATGGVELGGNKLRKLEFLLADAIAKGCDSIVTIGGEQSNHCRATAAASRMVGLTPNLILRTRRADKIHDKIDELGFEGNILFDRMVGSTVYTCTPGEYGRVGSKKLVEHVCNYIVSNDDDGSKPYPIPVGGSNGVGSWGYINAVDELMHQMGLMTKQQQDQKEDDKTNTASNFNLDHVVFATGSGGTAAGISLGLSLAYESVGQLCPPMMHAVGVCDNPDYFYQTMALIADEMGISLSSFSNHATTEDFIRDIVTVHHGKGRGYALSTEEELDFILQFSLETGIALDPVYSGKALYHFLKHVVEEDPTSYRDKNVLFWHTGGALGIYEKGDDLLPKFSDVSPVKRIDVYGSNGVKETIN